MITARRGGQYGNVDSFAVCSAAELWIGVRTKMDWQEKYVILIIDKVRMLSMQTLYSVNKQLCRLQEST